MRSRDNKAFYKQIRLDKEFNYSNNGQSVPEAPRDERSRQVENRNPISCVLFAPF